MAENTVLLVDDELQVLRGLTRELYEADVCTIQTASNADEGLSIIYNNPNIRAVVSDFHMPGMKGIPFLAEVKNFNPDITRIILTGAADLNMAIEAVNRGHIFRFLVKPCPSDILIETVKAGIRQYHLQTGEKELLQKTLSGSIKIMVDILAALDPVGFAQSNRLRDLARSFAIALQMERIWEVELAALLSQIGTVTVPREVLEKRSQGYQLQDHEMDMILAIPRIGAQLVQNIPRLENVSKAILYQNTPYKNIYPSSSEPSGSQIPQSARLLKIITDYDRYLTDWYGPETALGEMFKNRDEYDPTMLEVFRLKIAEANFPKVVLPERSDMNVEYIQIEDIQPGVVLAKDILDKRGRLMVSKGTVITDVLKMRLVNFFRTQAMLDPIVIKKER